MSEYLELKELPKNYISFTQINMARRCLKQYELRYIEGYKYPPPLAVARGSSTHKTYAHVLREKKEKQITWKVKDVVDLFVANFDEIVKNNEFDTKNEKPEEVRDLTIQPLKQCYEGEVKIYHPRSVEEEFVIEFENVDYKLYGVIDTIERDNVVEFKTSKSSPADPLGLDEQLQLYSIRYPNLFLVKNILVCQKTNPRYVQFKWKSDENRAKKLLTVVNQIALAIRTGIFYPNPGFNNINCKMCGYGPQGMNKCDWWR
jgi:RecB family exonuclease